MMIKGPGLERGQIVSVNASEERRHVLAMCNESDAGSMLAERGAGANGHGRQLLGVLSAPCHAASDRTPVPPNESYVLLYHGGFRHDGVAEGVWATPLEAAALSEKIAKIATVSRVLFFVKHASTEYCKALSSEAASCLQHRDNGREDFHNILADARLIISPWSNTDNPALLEAAACGTPIIVQGGLTSTGKFNTQSAFLEWLGSPPYAFTYHDNTEADLLGAVHEAVHALQKAGVPQKKKKLAGWRPCPLQPHVVMRRLQELMRKRRHACLHEILAKRRGASTLDGGRRQRGVTPLPSH